jgi:hypothetical protein
MLDPALPYMKEGALAGCLSEIPKVSEILLPALDKSYQTPLLTS